LSDHVPLCACSVDPMAEVNVCQASRVHALDTPPSKVPSKVRPNVGAGVGAPCPETVAIVTVAMASTATHVGVSVTDGTKCSPLTANGRTRRASSWKWRRPACGKAPV
jgi:hypothetical protein